MGYESMDGREFVRDEDALDYVLKQGGLAFVNDDAPEAEAFKKELVEWYFSGNWVRVDD